MDAVANVDQGILEHARRSMLALDCAHALVIDSQKAHVLRDTFNDMIAASIQDEASLDSALLLVGDPGSVLPPLTVTQLTQNNSITKTRTSGAKTLLEGY